ncbi:hypothetical protein KC336_g20659, partial [Hortaea werneckii]
VTAAEISFVAESLHPTCSANDGAEDEDSLVEDFDIKFNLYYHKGTTNTREARNRHLDNKQRKKSEPNIEESEIDTLIAALKIPSSSMDSKDQQNLVREIRDAIRDDLVRMSKEDEQTAIRKAGFWRWASKKTYDLHVANAKARAQKGDAEMPKRKDSADPVAEPEDVQEVEGNAPRKMESTDSIAETTDAVRAPTTPTTGLQDRVVLASGSSGSKPQSEEKLDTDEAEWTTVGSSKLSARSDKMLSPTTLKLTGNGGLKKLQVKTSGYSAIAFSGNDD